MEKKLKFLPLNKLDIKFIDKVDICFLQVVQNLYDRLENIQIV